MGYRVEYAPVKKVRRVEKRTVGIPAMTAVCLLLFLLLVSGFWPQGSETLREILIPGDPVVTVAALEELAVELGAGEELDSALESFCRKIVAEADLASG